MVEPIWDGLLSDQARLHGRLFFRLAHQVLRDPEAADDVCQQAFLRAWEVRDHIQSPDALTAWLARAVFRNALLALRKRKAERRAVRTRGASSGSDWEGPPGAEGELREAVWAAMDRLPERTRLVVAMRVFDDRKGNEVKDLLGCSASEVSREFHRGLDQLRALLAHCETTLA